MNQILNLIKSLINNTLPVQEVANVIVLNYAPFVYELSKIIDRQFHDQKYDKKSLCVTLVCEILKKSLEHECSRNFVKGLAQRLRYFLHSMSRNYVSEGVALQINRNIDSLKYTGLFCDEYFQKLQTLARIIKQTSGGPENSRSLQKSQSFEDNEKNYSRTFLTMVKDINKCGNLKNILQTYNEFILTEKDNLSKMALKKQKSIDQINSRQDEDGKKSFQQISLFEKDMRREKLEKIIEECHWHIFDLRRQMSEEVRRFEQGLIFAGGKKDIQCKFYDIPDEQVE